MLQYTNLDKEPAKKKIIKKNKKKTNNNNKKEKWKPFAIKFT